MIEKINISGAYQQYSASQTEHVKSTPLPEVSQQELSEDASASVQLSDAAIQQHELSKNTEEAEAFISENNSKIYEKTLVDFNHYPENIASKLDRDSGLSSDERREAQSRLNQREFEAFGKYAKQSPPDMEAYYANYIEYLDSLSPEEQASERYRGQRQAVVPLYESAARENGSQPRDFSFTQDPILSLFEALEKRDFEIEDVDTFRQTYLNRLAPLFENNENSQSLVEEATLALNNVEQTNKAISAALEGDAKALTAIKALVNDELSAESFLNLTFAL